MRTYKLALVALLAGVGSAFAQYPAAQNHPQSHTIQFIKQCLDATDNWPFCNCALNAFKKNYPAGDTRLESDENYDQLVLKGNEDNVEKLVPAIQSCRQKHPKRNQSRNGRN